MLERIHFSEGKGSKRCNIRLVLPAAVTRSAPFLVPRTVVVGRVGLDRQHAKVKRLMAGTHRALAVVPCGSFTNLEMVVF